MTNKSRDASPVRAGLLGVGYWGTRIAKAAAVTPEIEIVTCCARSDTARSAFAAEYGFGAAASYEAMLDDPSLDAVLIITPNSVHYDQIRLAIAHGKHVFVDKPLTATVAQGVEVIKAADKAGLVLAVDQQVRQEAAVRRLKDLLERGALGNLLMAESNLSTRSGLAIKPGAWRWQRSECPGGPLIQIGIHHIDALQYLLGPIVRVQGWQKHRYIAAPIDDTTVTLLEFANGMFGYLGSGYASAPSAWIRIYGEAAVATCNRHEGLSVTGQPVGTQAEEWAVPATSSADPAPALQDALRDFARCVRQGGIPTASGRDGLSALAVVLGAVQSQQSGRAVAIPDLLRQAGADW